jgi:MFS family permease
MYRVPGLKAVGIMQNILKTNIATIYLMAFCHGFMVVIPVFVPLLQGYGLSMAEVLQTQAMFALTVAICEVPSGYLADMWGRKRAILVGSALNGLGFLSLLWADSFADFIVYELILGVGISLISGADLALLYDTENELQELGGGSGTGKTLSRLISVETAASGLAGVGASVLLLWGSMEALIQLQVVSGFLPAILALRLTEAPRPVLKQGHANNARKIFQLLLFGRPVVLWTTLAIVCFGLVGVYSFWLYQKYWELQGVPLAWFGYIWAAFALLTSLAARYASSLEQRIGWRAVLAIAAVLPVAGWLGMALGSGLYGVLFGLAIQLSRGLSLTIFYEALNRRVDGEFRATVNSLASLGVRSVFILSGPLLGYMLDRYGMTSTLLGLVLLFAPVLLLLIFGLGSRISREAQQTPPEATRAGYA